MRNRASSRLRMIATKFRKDTLRRSAFRFSVVMAIRNFRMVRWTGSSRKAITAPIKMGRRITPSVPRKPETSFIWNSRKNSSSDAAITAKAVSPIAR